MKTFLKNFVPVCLAVLAFSACNKETNVPATPEKINITVKAVPEAFANPETKTYIDETQTIIWGKGEYMTIGVLADETTVFATSSEESADAWDGEPEAYFGFSLTPGATADAYTYVGMYPASAAVDYNGDPAYGSNKNAAAFKVSLPSTQNATATSYDPAAYIMIAKPEPFDAIQTEWTASYRRATALNKVTLTNIPEDIVSVEFTAPDEMYMAGRRYIDLTTGESGDLYGDTRTETIEVKASLTGESKVVWFTSWGIEIPVGSTFKIVAKSATKSYTRTLTVANKSINFKEGYLNTLKVNMASAEVAELENYEGNYIIGAKPESTWFLMTSENGYNYYTKANTTVTATPEAVSYSDFTDADDYIWTVSKVEGGYAFKSVKTGKYLDLTNDANQAQVSDTPVAFSLTIASDHKATVKSNTYTERVLQYNAGNPRFAFYKGTQKDIYMIPATIDEREAVTLSFAEAAIETDTDDLSFTGQAVIADPNVAAITNNITWTIEDPDEITSSFEDGVLALSGNPGTATVTASFEGDDNYKKASASYTIKVSRSGSAVPVAGDILFYTDFGTSASSLADYTGGTSFNDASTISYAASNASYVKIDTNSATNMTSGNLYMSGKNGGVGLTATISGIKTYGAKAITVTWAANNAYSTLTVPASSSEGVDSANSAANSATFALAGTEETISLVFTTNSGSNTRVDNLKVVFDE